MPKITCKKNLTEILWEKYKYVALNTRVVKT